MVTSALLTAFFGYWWRMATKRKRSQMANTAPLTYDVGQPLYQA